jgi:hypothetical protein
MAVRLMAESLGKPEAAAGKKTLPGMAARAVLDVMTAAMGSVRPAGVERAGLDDQDRAPSGRLAAAHFAQAGPADAATLGHQPSWPAR